jgi:TolB-like protein
VKFIAVMRERRLFQIVFSYIAGCWVLLSVLDQLVGREVMPELAYTVALIWALIGLPAAVLIGWHHGEKGKQTAPVSEIIVLVLLALTATGFSGVRIADNIRAGKIAASMENPPQLRKLAVMYFKDESPDSANQYIADALTEGLIDELKRIPELTVISSSDSAQYRNRSFDADSIPVIANDLDVGTIVTGTIEPHGDKIRVKLELLEGQSGARFKPMKPLEYPANDLLAMRAAIVTQTSEVLRETLGKEIRAREAVTGTTKVGAWSLLQRAERARKDAEAALKGEGGPVAAAALFARADSLLAEAEAVDREWTQPIDDRAAIAYRQSRIAQNDPAAAVPLIDKGLAHAERALKLSPHDARALELRGTLNYFRWLLQVEPDAKAQQKLFDDARSDVNAAVRYQPSLASAHATLSHMNYFDNVPQAILEAEKAYEQDAYLETAPLILWRLFNGNYEQSVFTLARKWCTEGQRRFPADYRFVNCQLRLLNIPGIKADSISIPGAWAMLAKQDSLTPAPRMPFEHARGEMIVAGAIALKGNVDSARAVLNRASTSVTREVDPAGELGVVEAYIRVLTGEKDRAVDLLTRAAAADPAGFEKNKQDIPWYWDKLRDHPRFKTLFGIN